MIKDMRKNKPSNSEASASDLGSLGDGILFVVWFFWGVFLIVLGF